MSALAGAAAAMGVAMSDSLVEADAAWAAEGDEVKKVRTSCHGCIQMCPAIATIVNGVVTKLEGDPDGPVSRGSLCIKGLNQLHTMYSPRRVLHPIKRVGERGTNDWEIISWDEALQLAAEQITGAIDKYGPYAFFSAVGGGGAYSFIEAMTINMALGSPTVFEPGCAQCYLPRMAMANYMYGGADQSIADNAVQEIFRPGEDNKSEVVVLWAAQPSVSQTAESGRGIAETKALGVKTIVVDPHFSPDAAKADIWLPVRPGCDTGVLLSWFRYIFENKLYNEEFTKYWTNLPFLIDPDTKLPVKAQELFPDFVQSTPANTPAYVCVDAATGEAAPLEFGLPENIAVDPEIFATIEIDGKEYKTAGQIYKEEAEPWTLEHTEELCWTPADRNEAAIRLYTHADEEGGCLEHVSGICDGLASDMTEEASQVPLGCLGLDAIMGYVNKPGVTLTQKGMGSIPTSRPMTFHNGFGGMFSNMYGVGGVVGMSDEENEARIQGFTESMPEVQKMYNQILLDRLGMKDHKGLYTWCHSHIPTVREAIATGEPYKPRVWFDMSGNKLAVLGNAKSWYDVFPECDFIIGQYPMLTSFHIEAADLVFPLREWLEEPMVNMNQLGVKFLQNECTHIGETVSHSIPGAQVLERCREIWGHDLPGAPLAYMGTPTEGAIKQSVAEQLGAPDWDTLQADVDAYVPNVPEGYFQYDQQLTIVDDGLPAGFATESRKFEVYCTLLLKMARTGWPFCYPEPQEACEDYSPICCWIEPCESPYSESEQQLADRDEYPLILTSGRLPYFHHGTMRHAAFSRELFPTAQIQINPVVAEEKGIQTNDWVKITSRRGETFARALVTEAVHPGMVWMERFWNPECYDASQPKITGGWREENVNILTKNTAPFNEVFGSYTNRGFTVKIEKGEKPEGVWVEPEEFAPFLPTLQSEPKTEDVF